MGEVKAVSEIDIVAEPEAVLDAVADYATVRPKILPSNYRDYAVVQGGKGDGTIVRWTLQATKKRVRYVEAAISVKDNTVTETDANSTMVTTWTVTPISDGARVAVETTWAGAGGIGGVFEGLFAPVGLRKIQAETLANLAKQVK